jgi:uncharacterized protein (DUF924 family)
VRSRSECAPSPDALVINVKKERSMWIDEVNRFWFEELAQKDWFSARSEVDERIRARFADLHATLEREPPDPTALGAEGHVAAVIVLDQFSRNLFRRRPEAFSTDAAALALALHAADHGLDATLAPHQRQFLYMPFMHSEDRAMQARSVQLFAAIGMPDVLRYAEHHKVIVDRFGRFPHRNEILGRTSTEAEREFLRDSPGFA